MKAARDYPGTHRHRKLLRAIVSWYADDLRVLAVCVSGSLGRGTWDEYSDLDLDIVTAFGVKIDVIQELRRLCDSFASIGEKAALIIPDGDEAGDVVLESLMELSIRYHPLHLTSPNILDSLEVLSGRIEPAMVRAAGLANRQKEEPALELLVDRTVRYAVEADAALCRGRRWAATELLHRMRGLLMELFARARERGRGHQVFDAQADEALQRRLGATLPQYDLASARKALTQILDIVERDLGLLTNGRVRLADPHKTVLRRVRVRQASLKRT